MTHNLSPSRCATAAIAAVLATLPPAAFAQDSVPAASAPSVASPSVASPSVAVPSPVTATAAPPVAPAPQIVLPTTQAAATVQPLPPSSESDIAPAIAAQPQRRAVTERASAPVERRAAPAAIPVAATVATPIAAPVMPLGAPSELAAAVPPVVSATNPVAPAAEPALSPLELGLIGSGFAVVGLGLITLLLRRRREDEADALDVPVIVAPQTDYPPQPLPRANVQPIAQPLARARGATTAQAVSHAAAVDDGPTDANPFLTRKNRLRRAHFMDRQATMQRDRDARTLAGQRVMQSGHRPHEPVNAPSAAAAD